MEQIIKDKIKGINKENDGKEDAESKINEEKKEIIKKQVDVLKGRINNFNLKIKNLKKIIGFMIFVIFLLNFLIIFNLS